MRLRCIGLRIVRPFLLVGFDPRQIRPRLPAPGQARYRASPRQARPDYRRQAWGTPLACGLKPSGNRTVKTLHRSVFRQSSGRAVSSRAACFPERFSPIVFGLRPVTPTSARHKTAMRCDVSTNPHHTLAPVTRGRKGAGGDARDRAAGSGIAPAHEPRKSRHRPPTGFRRLPWEPPFPLDFPARLPYLALGLRSLAQLVEHRSPRPRVVGSSPPSPASLFTEDTFAGTTPA